MKTVQSSKRRREKEIRFVAADQDSGEGVPVAALSPTSAASPHATSSIVKLSNSALRESQGSRSRSQSLSHLAPVECTDATEAENFLVEVRRASLMALPAPGSSGCERGSACAASLSAASAAVVNGVATRTPTPATSVADNKSPLREHGNADCVSVFSENDIDFTTVTEGLATGTPRRTTARHLTYSTRQQHRQHMLKRTRHRNSRRYHPRAGRRAQGGAQPYTQTPHGCPPTVRSNASSAASSPRSMSRTGTIPPPSTLHAGGPTPGSAAGGPAAAVAMAGPTRSPNSALSPAAPAAAAAAAVVGTDTLLPITAFLLRTVASASYPVGAASAGAAAAPHALPSVALPRPAAPPPSRTRFDGMRHARDLEQARESQAEMRRFEGVLTSMQEEAWRVRWRTAGERGGGAAADGRGDGGGGGSDDDNDDSNDAARGDGECGAQEMDEVSSRTGGRAGAASRGSGSASGGGAPAMQLRTLQRQLASAERHLRLHPELDETLEKEVAASEMRLSAVRTARVAGATARNRRETTAAAAALEHVDWSGTAPPGAKEDASESSGLLQLLSSSEPLILPPAAAVDGEGCSRGETATSGRTEGALVPTDASADPPALSASLRDLPLEELLSELLERGNGRAVYGVPNGSRAPRSQVPRGGHGKTVKRSPPQPGSTNGSPAPPSMAAATAAPASAASPLTDAAHARLSETNPDDTLRTGRPTSRRVTFSPPRAGSRDPPVAVAGPGTAVGECAANAQGTARRKPKAAVRRARAAHEALPVSLGVGERSALALRCEMARTRLECLEARVALAKDTRRTCELLERLQPMRAALLDRDVTNVFDVTDPLEWERKYPLRRDACAEERAGEPAARPESGGGRSDHPLSLPLIHERSTLAAERRALVTVDSVRNSVESRAEPPRIFANPRETLERHRQEVFATAREMDDAQRLTSRLLYVDVLEHASRRQVPTAMWPAVSAALKGARELLTSGPRDRQGFVGFQSLVQANFSPLELVQWPVQQTLSRLAALFLLSPREYQEWLANLYQKLSSTHDYQARFRAVDRSVKDRHVPDEAHVRIVLHACRRLPRGLLTSMGSASLPRGAAGGPSVALGAAQDPTAIPFRSPTEPKPLTVGSPAPGLLPGSPDSPGLVPALATLAAGGPRLSLLGGRRGAPQGMAMAAAAESLYAVRVEAEQMSMTSAAMPAAAGSAGARPGIVESGAERATEAGPGSPGRSAAAGGAASAGKKVYFHDQTFKLHLYDVNSPVRVTLLRDGQPIAEGVLSALQHQGGRRSQVWLPLTLAGAATDGTPRSTSGVPQPHRKPEIRMTVEYL